MRFNTVCNRVMKSDAALIDALGGPAKVAELLGYDKQRGGVQRVHNWLGRGIPPRVKLERPDLFPNPAERVRVAASAEAA
jgi:hypothetical protein